MSLNCFLMEEGVFTSFICSLFYVCMCVFVHPFFCVFFVDTKRSYGWHRFSVASGLPTQPLPPYPANQPTTNAYGLNTGGGGGGGGGGVLGVGQQSSFANPHQCLLHRTPLTSCNCLQHNNTPRDVSPLSLSVWMGLRISLHL